MQGAILKVRYGSAVERMLLISLFQMQWSRAEPCGFLDAIARNPLPNTPAHRVLVHYGLGDAQVSWLGSYAMARAVGMVTRCPTRMTASAPATPRFPTA